MGTYCELYVADYPTYSTKSAVDPIVMTIFREADKREFERTIGERNQLQWSHIEDKDEIETAYEYANTVANIKQRLEVLGFSLKNVREEFETVKEDIIDDLKRMQEYTKSADLSTHYFEEWQLVEHATFEDFLAAFREILERKLRVQLFEDKLPPETPPLIRHILGPHSELHFNFPCADIRCFLRALIEVCPEDALVIQDITDLVHAGYYAPDEPVCEIALGDLIADYPINEKIIILTEGSTDKNILEQSMRLLYPHLFDYYSFMDFGVSNAPGSASSLVATIKAFVGSGISNRIIALFDNDTAAQMAIRGLSRTTIPPNIKILKYPDTKIARNYPTLGPSGISELDINGLACSIELYFGNDILTADDGKLIPIQWKGYEVNLNQYQGEILRKKELQNTFSEKLARCSSNPSLVNETDWESIRLILVSIFGAFA